MRENTQQKRWIILFTAIAVLVFAQVSWWLIVFMRHVDLIAQLKVQLGFGPEVLQEAMDRRFMFISESVTFVFLTCVALYLLFHAIRKEKRSRDIQRNFIDIVTHESKTPLTALKLRLESVMEHHGANNSELHRELALAREEVRRLISIFEKVLSLNRLEREAVTFDELSLANDVVSPVLRRLGPFLKANHVHLFTELPEEVAVKGDAFGLQNCLQSLVENAVFYNPAEKKEIRISLKSEGPWAVLTVSDNGPGIAEKDKKHLFERFYRGTMGNLVSGTGLGLYITKSIVDAHHGTVQYVGGQGGAAFEIRLAEVRQ